MRAQCKVDGMLEPGLYEQTISRQLREQIDASSEDESAEERDMDGAEASRILSSYVEKVVRVTLDSIGGEGASSVSKKVQMTNSIVNGIAATLSDEEGRLSGEMLLQEVEEPVRELLSVVPKRNVASAVTGGRPRFPPRPTTSVARTSLFTGSAHEPQLYSELKREIASASTICMLVSFVKWSGLRLIMDELREFCEGGGKLYVITTSYVGATDPKAVTELAKLPNAHVRVSYDTSRTRLHAKAYVFERSTGFTTAYVGSSNLSNPAMTSGLEWNVKVSKADQPDTLAKIEATFQTYWKSPEFETYTTDDQGRLERAIDRERHGGADAGSEGIAYSFDITPYPFQQQILDRLRAEREVGNHWHNLVVAATGTGKTVVSAFDYRDFCRRYASGRRARMLFVAHREEILRQGLACFRGVLRDPNFGQLFVGQSRPDSLDHLFASIQTISSRDLTGHLDPSYYDYIVVDEIHHEAAATYGRFLDHFEPKVLLGLTATPERSDGKSILGRFDGRIAAEIRLPEAIDRKLLCPFSYFGVSDTVDLDGLRWSRGGYDESALENVYVFDRKLAERRAANVIDAVRRYVTDIDEVHGLGFCVSKAHARFMAERFEQAGIHSLALTADTPDEERERARERLSTGEVKFIFSVDIFNEGVDVPEVDTVLFLRPTQSLTVFLQQLGRGLRLSPGKECLTVLDFIGQQNRRYDFACRLRAILEPTTSTIGAQVLDGFPAAPKGCYIHLERVAQRHVLDNIRSALGTRSALVERIATFEEDSGLPLSLKNFVERYHLDVRDIYRHASFTRLCVAAGAREDFHEHDEEVLAKALLRLSLADSRRWIHFLLQTLDGVGNLDWDSLEPLERRMLSMFQITLWPSSFREGTFDNPTQCVRRVLSNPVMAREIKELLQIRLDSIDFVDEPVDLGFECPLDLHCQYTRDQIFVAMDRMDPQNIRQGVAYLRDKGVDVLINTLNKSEREYSPSTMYEDYSIDEWHFHWQSQNKTTPESPTGQRYIHQRDEKSGTPTKVALFAREYNRDQYGTEPFTFLGLVHHESHSGSRPMSIVWKLSRPIPAKFLLKSNKLAS
jgi:superfamily II DNA or RNA helicase